MATAIADTMNRDAISVAFQADLPVLIWGYPGQGKSRFVEQLADVLGAAELITIIGSIYEPQDVGGLPFRMEELGVFDYLPPYWVHTLADPTSILFLDEINTASPAMQAAMLRVVLERRIGRHKVECRIIAAANPPEVSAGGMELALPLANRFVHFNWKMDPKTFTDGMVNGFDYTPPILSHDWVDLIPSARQDVASFLAFKPALVTGKATDGLFPPAFPTPRTWDFASTFLAAARATALSKNQTVTGLNGIVGAGATAELVQHVAVGTGGVSLADIVADPARHLPAVKTREPDVVVAVFQGVNQLRQSNRINDKQIAAVYTAAATLKFPADVLQAQWSAIVTSVNADTAAAVRDAMKKGGAK